jgi:DNA-binding helix-hairpin-helix protein with protein kinase domain
MRVLLERSPDVGPLECRPLVHGGEATIYELPRFPTLIAKVYHTPTAEHAAKLSAMLATPPADPLAATGHPSIAWPVDRLVAAEPPRGCVGYVMPRVVAARPAFEFYNPRSRIQVCPGFHYGYLLRTARNLAAAVRALHERDTVLGDLNESNTLVTNQALVTLVDTDSFQVADHGRVYRCPVGKPEYTPPELQQVRFADFDRGPEHDAFALAVLVFQLLQQGVHPFAGRYTGDGEPEDLARRITRGHWPYARSRKVPYTPPPGAPPFDALPPAVQDLIRQCFEGGHARSVLRPTAVQWQEALAAAERDLMPCPDNSNHFAHPGLPCCPWCVLARRLGRDPFPARAVPAPPVRTVVRSARPTKSPLAAAVSFAAVATSRRPDAIRPHPVVVSYPVPHPAWPARQSRPTPAAGPVPPTRAASPWGWVAGVALALGAAASLSWLALGRALPETLLPRRTAAEQPPAHPALLPPEKNATMN